MARPIAPTPVLGAKASKKFLKKVKRNQESKVDYTPTPNIEKAVKLLLADDRKEKK